jgi:hypothetical protein
MARLTDFHRQQRSPQGNVSNYSAKTIVCLVLVVVLFSWVVLNIPINITKVVLQIK